MITLDDFNNKILKPMTIRSIENGSLDEILLDSDVLKIISNDKELMKAFVGRIPALKKRFGVE